MDKRQLYWFNIVIYFIVAGSVSCTFAGFAGIIKGLFPDIICLILIGAGVVLGALSAALRAVYTKYQLDFQLKVLTTHILSYLSFTYKIDGFTTLIESTLRYLASKDNFRSRHIRMLLRSLSESSTDDPRFEAIIRLLYQEAIAK